MVNFFTLIFHSVSIPFRVDSSDLYYLVRNDLHTDPKRIGGFGSPNLWFAHAH